jgi:hypothetical protein
VLKLADDASLRFREALEARVERGFNEPNGYYFFIVRKMLREQGIEIPVFDFAGERWQEIDHIADIASAQARFGPSASRCDRVSPSSSLRSRRENR